MLTQSRSFFPFLEIFKEGMSRYHFDQLSHEGFFNHLIDQEFHYLTNSETYLDYTQSTLYPASVLKMHMELMLSSNHMTGKNSSVFMRSLASAKESVLSFFNAQDYHCVFTKGLEDSLHVATKLYPFSGLSRALFLADNQGTYQATADQLQEQIQVAHSILSADYTIDAKYLQREFDKCEAHNNLFVLPAQSSVTGIKHDLKIVEQSSQKNWDVFLDADHLLSTAALDLSKVKPMFVGFSFAKMLGYPADLGCLLIHKSFLYANAVEEQLVASENHNGQAISAVKYGLNFLSEVGVKRIEGRCHSMTQYLMKHLSKLKHETGHSVVQIIGNNQLENRSNTVLIKIRDGDGVEFKGDIIQKRAQNQQLILGLEDHQSYAVKWYLQLVNNALDGSTFMQEASMHNDMVRQHNELQHTVRISVGIATRKQDLDAVIAFAESFSNQLAN